MLPGKRSRPVITPHGKVIEEIEPRAFEQAIGRAGNITVTVDHDNSHVYASTDDGTLKLFEDDIGLHADVLVTDETLIELAKKGKVKGWSFGMYNVQDEVEPRADELPLRKVKSLDLDDLTLVVRKIAGVLRDLGRGSCRTHRSRLKRARFRDTAAGRADYPEI